MGLGPRFSGYVFCRDSIRLAIVPYLSSDGSSDCGNTDRTGRGPDTPDSRGEVLLDRDLAELYEVTIKQLNQAVKRNRTRFPPDFMFQLDWGEWDGLRSQIVTSKSGRGGRRYAPYAFTEHGAVMAATVLRSERAVAVSIVVVRAFVRLRKALAAHGDLARKLAELEQKYDQQFQVVFQAIREILDGPQVEPKQRGSGIGFGRSE